MRFGHEGQRGGRRGAAASSLTHESARFISCFEHRVACVAFGILRVAYFCDRRGVRCAVSRVRPRACSSRGEPPYCVPFQCTAPTGASSGVVERAVLMMSAYLKSLYLKSLTQSRHRARTSIWETHSANFCRPSSTTFTLFATNAPRSRPESANSAAMVPAVELKYGGVPVIAIAPYEL